MLLEPTTPGAPSAQAALQPGAGERLGSCLSQEQGSPGSSALNFILASICAALSLQPQLQPTLACSPASCRAGGRRGSLLIQPDVGRGSQGFQAGCPAGFPGSPSPPGASKLWQMLTRFLLISLLLTLTSSHFLKTAAVIQNAKMSSFQIFCGLATSTVNAGI